MSEPGLLVLCATPIGNLGDVSQRLREALDSADLIYAEDTRRVATLLAHLGIQSGARSLFAGNEARRSTELLGALEAGKTVALVTDAGMPGISDPGALAVRLAREGGHRVTAIPGPSAVVTAIALSGFGGDRFSFEGFLPRKGAERSILLQRIAGDDRPTVVFVSPHRLAKDLADLAAVVGEERPIALTRELTKLHEEVWVGSIGMAITEWSERAPKGEFTLVIGPGSSPVVTLEEAADEALELVRGGMAASEAAASVARATGVHRREIYQKLLDDQGRS